MSNEVSFEEEANSVGSTKSYQGAPTGLIAWLIKSKFAKNKKQAEQILLGTAIVAIVAAVGIFIQSSGALAPRQSPAQIQAMVAQMQAEARAHTPTSP